MPSLTISVPGKHCPRNQLHFSLFHPSIMGNLSIFIALGLLVFPPLASSFSFELKNIPQQCGELTVAITGQGQPPYSVLILPFGVNPAVAPAIISQSFSGDSVSVLLKSPANTQIVVVVSDSTRFGSGGTSAAITVQDSFDHSCPTGPPLDWYFSIEPQNRIVQCQNTRLLWFPPDPPAVIQGTPEFVGVIPGGQSFPIPNSSITTVPEHGTGFNWTVNVRAGTTFILVGGDDRGLGNSGYFSTVVDQGVTINDSCIDATSPSSTPGSPAGSLPTGTGLPSSPSPSPTRGNKSLNIAAIIGIVVGVLIILVVAIFLIARRRKRRRKHHNALTDEADWPSNYGVPSIYRPEAFLLSEQTSPGVESSSFGMYSDTSDDRSRWTSSDTPPGSAGSRKSNVALRPTRPVTIIEHDDAGPSEPMPRVDEEPETIELPPAYTRIKRLQDQR